MKLRYSYHSDHHAGPTNRWVHFTLFLGAFLLLLAAGQQWFLYFTDWHTSEEDHPYWHLALGLLYLLVGGTMVYFGYRQKNARRGVANRYVRVGEDQLAWRLGQESAKQTVDLKDLATVERPNIRDLKLTLNDGTTITLPIYLIASEPKQDELLETLTALV
jgi:hypothetical protein